MSLVQRSLTLPLTTLMRSVACLEKLVTGTWFFLNDVLALPSLASPSPSLTPFYHDVLLHHPEVMEPADHGLETSATLSPNKTCLREETRGHLHAHRNDRADEGELGIQKTGS